MKIEVSQNPRMSPFGDSMQWVITHNDFGASKAPAGLDLVPFTIDLYFVSIF